MSSISTMFRELKEFLDPASSDYVAHQSKVLENFLGLPSGLKKSVKKATDKTPKAEKVERVFKGLSL